MYIDWGLPYSQVTAPFRFTTLLQYVLAAALYSALVCKGEHLRVQCLSRNFGMLHNEV